ncbi:MAG: tryptophan synthase subunit beta, partial [Prolixibacteraceae bacterium]|nr:tryptophan synthase subunit beta [Prolixibacteraceae bacterium]
LEMTGELPDNVMACVGGGSNAARMFSAFLEDEEGKLWGVGPAGRSYDLGEHACTMKFGSPGMIHGFKCKVLQDENGEPSPVYSVASGLDYPGVGPEHCLFEQTGRVNYVDATDAETIEAFYELSRLEGIIPALESAHATAFAKKHAPNAQRESILINLSGRGDKDIDFVVDTYGLPK